MASFMENVGLQSLIDDEESVVKLIRIITQQGDAIVGYGGYYQNFRMGDVVLIARCEIKEEEKSIQVLGMDMHCDGNCIWECRVTGPDITPKDFDSLQKRCMVGDIETGNGMLIINIMNADVLPSYMEDDIIRMQMVGLPKDINYFSNEDEYADAQPEGRGGRKFLLADGAILATGFLHNHNPDTNKGGANSESDDCMLVRGTVQRFYVGKSILGDKELSTFVKCVINTDYGELELIHTYDAVSEEQKANLKEGAIVSALCVLSGNVAIGEYKKSMVQDEEHSLRLIRSCLSGGAAKKLRFALEENNSAFIDSNGKIITGSDVIISHFHDVFEKSDQNSKRITRMATLNQDVHFNVGDETKIIPASKKCIVMAEEDAQTWEQIVFIELADDADIKKIRKIMILSAQNCNYLVDEPLKKEDPTENYTPPTKSRDTFMLWGQYGMMIGEEDELNKLSSSEASFKVHAQDTFVGLQRAGLLHSMDTLLKCFGYLFAKQMEIECKEQLGLWKRKKYNVEYNLEDAFQGMIKTSLPEDLNKKVLEAMAEGSQLGKAFRQYVEANNPDEETFRAELMDSLILIQRFGEIYAKKNANL